MVEIEGLDPGIRRVVALLNEWSFKTIDSGDGVTKPALGWDAERIPHVYMSSSSEMLIRNADRLRSLLKQHGIAVGPCSFGVYIQATYDPGDGSAIIGLYGLSDAGLPLTPSPE